MSQNVITTAFEAYRAQCELNGQPVELDEIILALIPELDPTQPIDRAAVECRPEWVRHRQSPDQVGALTPSDIVYAVVLPTSLGDFEFNAMFLANRATGTIAMAVHKGIEQKLATTDQQTGNTLVKNMVMRYSGATEATQLQVDPSTWMVDWHQRLFGLMADEAASNRDIYGNVAFLADGFKPEPIDDQWHCLPGTAYVQGLRTELAQATVITGNGALLVAEVCQQGSALGAWHNVATLHTMDAVPESDTDAAGFVRHYALVAERDGNGWRDARRLGGLALYLEKAQVSHDPALESDAHVPSSQALSDVKKTADFALRIAQGAVVNLGDWNATSGVFPAKPYITDEQGNGQLVSAYWFVTGQGIVDGEEYKIGDKLNYSHMNDSFFKTDNTEREMAINHVEGLSEALANKATKQHQHLASDLPNASTTSKGVVQLSGATNSTSTVLAATASAVKAAFDLAASKLTQAAADARYLGKGAKAVDADKLDGLNSSDFSRSNHGHTAAQVGAVATAVLAAMFPPGHLLITTNSANPATYGYPGTWALIESDVSIRSATSGIGEVSGTNTPTVPVPAHTHSASSGSAMLNKRFTTNTTGDHGHSGSANSAGNHHHSGGVRINGYTTAQGAFIYGKGASGKGFTFGNYSSNSWEPLTNSAGLHTHSLSIGSDGSHYHYTDVNFGAHSHSVSVSSTGTSGATLDVRGRRMNVYMWKRAA
ncbi:phage tail protein [Ferrimonas senticii]|uniref:phage tail-collar fiber domain-containing protein n=1 Tax=Ferrimonas senticii TaxID=394566 RepID=UPI000418A13E|nr:phage tail protein [Ferrimonas senticii]